MGIAPEALLRRFFAPFLLRQTADVMALQAVMQRRTGQVREGRLQGVEAVAERRQGVVPEGHTMSAFSASLRSVERGCLVLSCDLRRAKLLIAVLCCSDGIRGGASGEVPVP